MTCSLHKNLSRLSEKVIADVSFSDSQTAERLKDMARKRFERKRSKYEDEAVLISSKVLKIEMQNQEINQKLKTVFYCESKAIPEGRMCVQWGKSNIQVGDEFDAKGRITPEGTFIVWSLMYRRKRSDE